MRTVDLSMKKRSLANTELPPPKNIGEKALKQTGKQEQNRVSIRFENSNPEILQIREIFTILIKKQMIWKKLSKTPPLPVKRLEF